MKEKEKEKEKKKEKGGEGEEEARKGNQTSSSGPPCCLAAGLKWGPALMHPLVLSPKAWMWKPCFPFGVAALVLEGGGERGKQRRKRGTNQG